MEAALLPYGSVYYHGAPASLRDIPIGTHLHGWFYMKHPDDDSKPLAIFHNRLSYEIDFRRCFRLEDDFSFYSRQKQLWHVDSVDLEEQKLTLTLQHDGKAIDKPQTLDLQKSTRVWRDHGFADQQVLSKGQLALFNIGQHDGMREVIIGWSSRKKYIRPGLLERILQISFSPYTETGTPHMQYM